MAVKIGRIPLGNMGTNCYFVYRDDLKEAIVFDPGDNGEYLYDKLKENGISVKAIFLTHGHFDHIYGVKALKKLSGAKVYSSEAELEILRDPDNRLVDDTLNGKTCDLTCVLSSLSL